MVHWNYRASSFFPEPELNWVFSKWYTRTTRLPFFQGQDVRKTYICKDPKLGIFEMALWNYQASNFFLSLNAEKPAFPQNPKLGNLETAHSNYKASEPNMNCLAPSSLLCLIS